MKIKHVVVVVGTRPQIIKSQPLIEYLTKNKIKVDIVNTGQHYSENLSDLFFKNLKIPTPAKNFKIGSSTQIEQLSKIITKLEKFLKIKRPDLVIVPGDTTSALAAAIVASKLGIKLCHLEAGARSNQFNMQEEINRRMIDHCSNILFSPTQNCLRNLKNESVYGKSFFVGDTMYDLFLNWRKKNTPVKKVKTTPPKILVTIHRAENIENKTNLKKISQIINKLSTDYEILFPIHPHTQKKIKENKLKINCSTLPPLSYTDLMKTIDTVSLIITDSGGLQKESYWMATPCITIRDHTEWTETISEGANILAPISKPFPFKKMSKLINKKIIPKKKLYGNGNACRNIYKILKSLE